MQADFQELRLFPVKEKPFRIRRIDRIGRGMVHFRYPRRSRRAAFQMITNDVQGDRVEPGEELFFGVEPFQLSVSPEEGLLRQVVGVLAASRHPEGQVEDRFRVGIDQDCEGRPFSPAHLGNDILLLLPVHTVPSSSEALSVDVEGLSGPSMQVFRSCSPFSGIG